MLTELERKGVIMRERELAMLARYAPSIATSSDSPWTQWRSNRAFLRGDRQTLLRNVR
jgi:hypothetical protein